MTLNKLILAGGVCLLFSQCDPTKKLSALMTTRARLIPAIQTPMITENMTMAITTTEMNTITMNLT